MYYLRQLSRQISKSAKWYKNFGLQKNFKVGKNEKMITGKNFVSSKILYQKINIREKFLSRRNGMKKFRKKFLKAEKIIVEEKFLSWKSCTTNYWCLGKFSKLVQWYEKLGSEEKFFKLKNGMKKLSDKIFMCQKHRAKENYYWKKFLSQRNCIKNMNVEENFLRQQSCNKKLVRENFLSWKNRSKTIIISVTKIFQSRKSHKKLKVREKFLSQ